MAAGLAPPTRLVRTFLAIMAAVVIALFVPAAPSHAHAGVSAASDDDGGKKKDKSSKKSDRHKDEKSSKKDKVDDDDDSSSSRGKRLDKDDDDDDSSASKGKKSDDDDDDADDRDSDDDDADDSDDDDSDDSDRDKRDRDSGNPGAPDDAGEPIARVTEDPSRGSVDPVQATEPAPKVDSSAPAAPVTAAAASGSLLASGAYLTTTDAIARARKAGAQGDVLQIDLEYDAFRGFATCDVTFTSGTEYEMNAETGEVLGEKLKAPAKLALLTPLATDSKSLKAFTDIIEQVSKATGQAVLEMEMKHPKGLPGVIFEVVTADGITSHFDAATGKPATGM